MNTPLPDADVVYSKKRGRPYEPFATDFELGKVHNR